MDPVIKALQLSNRRRIRDSSCDQVLSFDIKIGKAKAK